MKYSEKEVINALKVIKEVCENTEMCRFCPLRNGYDSCSLRSEIPSKWKLNEPREPFRAFKEED